MERVTTTQQQVYILRMRQIWLINIRPDKPLKSKYVVQRSVHGYKHRSKSRSHNEEIMKIKKMKDDTFKAYHF